MREMYRNTMEQLFGEVKGPVSIADLFIDSASVELQKARDYYHQQNASRPVIINTRSSVDEKSWHDENLLVRLASQAVERTHSDVFITHESIMNMQAFEQPLRKLSQEISARIKVLPPISDNPKFFNALLYLARSVITVDSGFMNFAIALGKPYVAIFPEKIDPQQYTSALNEKQAHKIVKFNKPYAEFTDKEVSIILENFLQLSRSELRHQPSFLL